MKNRYELGQSEFDALLKLFSDNREEAGKKYEDVRNGLVRFFQFKGCHDPESLADDAINRVASKLDTFDFSRNINPTAFFYGFATNILAEYRRTSNKEVCIEQAQLAAETANAEDDLEDNRTFCLQECMAKLNVKDRELIVKYFASEGRDKIERRREICDELGLSTVALHTRIFRLKTRLKACIEGCIKPVL